MERAKNMFVKSMKTVIKKTNYQITKSCETATIPHSNKIYSSLISHNR